MDALGITSTTVITEQTRYWVVEDLFPAGRPPFEAAGV
jgi:mannitol-1-phosphate/altronate dehydrogenase